MLEPFGWLVGGFFILYHIFGQPRLFTTGGDLSARIIFHFAGVIVSAVLAVCLMYFSVGGGSISEILAWQTSYLILFTGSILMVVDAIVLIKRHQKYKPEIPVDSQANDNKEIEELKGQIEKLQVDGRMLKAENETYKETLNSVKSKHADYDRRLSELQYREDELNRAKTALEKQKHADQLSSQEILRQKEIEVEKRYADKLLEEKEQLQERYHQKMTDFMDSVTEKLEKRIHSEKKNIVEDIFKFDGSVQDDVFELKRKKEGLDKEKENIEKNKFLLDVDERVSKAREHVLEAKNSALEVRSENVDLRSDLKVMASEFKTELLQEKTQREKSFDGVLHKLELEEEKRKSDYKDVGNKIALLAEQTKGKFIELTSMFSDNLKDMEMRTMTSFREVRENMSDMKLQFGQEVLRLDGQQGQILTELEKYYNKNQEFVHKCQNLALEAKKQNIDGNHLLNQVTSLYNQHKVDARAMENKLQTSLDQVAVKEGHLANRVGESMLQLKSVSEQQFIAMKDLALQKKDVHLLWKEKNQEHEMNLQEVRHQKHDLDRMRQMLDQDVSNFQERTSQTMENARQTHQLYMNEQRYAESLKKARGSGGFLTLMARGIEAMASKR